MRTVFASGVFHHLGGKTHWRRAIIPHAFDGAGAHLFETDNEHAVCNTSPHQRSGHMQTGGASSACIVRVVYGNT